MADIVYNSFKKKIQEKAIDLANDDFRIALLDDGHTPSDEHEFFDEVSGDEISGTGYNTGGELIGGLSCAQDNTGNRGVWDGNDVTWTGATFTARYGVIYQDTGNPATSPLVKLLDFTANKAPSGVDFKVQWNSEGILTFS